METTVNSLPPTKGLTVCNLLLELWKGFSILGEGVSYEVKCILVITRCTCNNYCIMTSSTNNMIIVLQEEKEGADMTIVRAEGSLLFLKFEDKIILLISLGDTRVC